MADKITNDITLLFKTKLDEKSKLEVGKNLKELLENAVIGFDEAETKKNLQPIIRMMKMLFDKAEMKFDADKLLSMPSRQALQEVASMTAEQFQSAFDRALAKSGGVKIDFGNIDLSGVTEPLERVADELSEINRKIANDTKKSVDDIDLAIKRLNKIKPKKINTKITEDGVEKEVEKEVSKVEQIVDAIDKTLNAINNPKSLTTEKGAVRALEKAALKYRESVSKDDPWELQYQYMVDFVSKYESMTKKIKPIMDSNHSEFKTLYDMLAPKAGAAKISLEHFVNVARDEELAEYKNQPWAREKTLERVANALENGISVKDDGGANKENKPSNERPKDSPKQSEPQKTNEGDENKVKKLNAKVSPKSTENKKPKQDSPKVKVDAAKEALDIAKQTKIEEEKAAEAAVKAAEAVADAVAEPVLTELQKRIFATIEEAKSKSSRSWENTDHRTREKLLSDAVRSNFIFSEDAENEDIENIINNTDAFSRGVSDIDEITEIFEPLVISLDDVYNQASDEAKELVKRLASLQSTDSTDALDILDQIADIDEQLNGIINHVVESYLNQWEKFRGKLLSNTSGTTLDSTKMTGTLRDIISFSGKQNKEYMSLIGADSSVDVTGGEEYTIPVDTLIEQLIDNVKNSILASLHNHPDGMLAFTPNDIVSYGKLYKEQGVDVHGIIADGIVQTIDFTGIAKETILQIAQSYSDSLSVIASNSDGLLSYEGGILEASSELQEMANTSPEAYTQIKEVLQHKINEALTKAFSDNGLESTVKTFNVNNLSELAEYLLKIGQGAKSAVDHVARLNELTSLKRSINANNNVKEEVDSHRENTEAIKEEAKAQERLNDVKNDASPDIKSAQRIIAVQKQWLEYLDNALNDDNFKTSGKKEATERLSTITKSLVDYRRHPEEYAGEEMRGEKLVVMWNKAYKEAERQGVAQSALTRNYTDAIYEYEEALRKLQEQQSFSLQTIAREEAKINALQQPAQDDVARHQENTAAIVAEAQAISEQEEAVKSLAEELKRVREESKKYQKEYLWSVGDDLKMDQIGEGYTQVSGDYSDTLYSGERFSLHNHYKPAAVVSGEVAPALSVGDVIDFSKAKELGTKLFAMIFDGVYTVIDTSDIGIELFNAIVSDYKSSVHKIEMDAHEKYSEPNQKRDYYQYIAKESQTALFELFKNRGLENSVYTAESDADLNALASKIFNSENITSVADRIKTIIMSAFDYNSSTRNALTKDSPLWSEVSDLLQVAEQKSIDPKQIISDIFNKMYDIVVNQRHVPNTKSLLPTADGLEAHTYAPSDEQKEYVLKLGEEYRAIMEILERGDSEFEDALIERANAIQHIMLETVRGNDGDLVYEYQDVYGGSRKTAMSLGDWRQSDELLRNVDSDKIDDAQRQAAIDLIYKEIEAEKQLEEARRQAKEERKQQELDTFRSKYEGASEDEKKLLYEISELEKEFRRLDDIGDEESHKAALDILEKVREKEKLLEKINSDLLDAYDDAGSKRAAPYIKEPSPVVAPSELPDDSVGEKVSIDTEELRRVLSAITYNVKVAQDVELAENSKISIDEAALEGVLNRVTYNVKLTHDDTDKQANTIVIDEDILKNVLQNIVYNVKLAHDDNDKESNKIAIDEKILESTLNRVFTNVLKPKAEPKADAKDEPWAREDTLKTAIKGVLDKIQTNTAKIGAVPQSDPNDIDSTLSVISKNIIDINSKIVKGTKAPNKDASKKKASDYRPQSIRNAQILTERIATQKLALAKFKAELETSDRMTEDVSKKIHGLAVSLGMVKDGKGLTRWNERFKQRKLEVGIADVENKEEQQFEQALQKEQETRLKSLNKLYQEYGVLVERAGAASGHFGEQLRDEVLAKEAEIQALKASMDIITPAMFDELDESYNRGRNIEATKQYEAFAKKSDADEATRRRNIANIEKEIGRLRADADAATNEGVKNAIEEEIKLREQLISLQRQGLEMEAQDEAYYRQNAANKTKQAKVDATQEIRDRKGAFKEQDKDEKRELAEQKQLIKEWVQLSEELGALDAKINSGLFDDKVILQAKEEREYVLRRIDELMALIDDPTNAFESAGAANFAGHYEAVTEQKSKLIGGLITQYEKLGQLEAKAEASGAFVDREKYAQLQSEVEAETQKLELNKEQGAELAQILQARQEVAYISAKDIEYAKEQKRLYSEYAALVKQVGKLDGIINSEAADAVAKQNAQMQKDSLMGLIDYIRPRLDLTEADLSPLWDANITGEEQSSVAQRQKAFTALARQYKELGEWQAKMDVQKTVEATGNVSRLQEEIAEKEKSLNLSEEELNILRQITEESKAGQIAALRDKQADKDTKRVAANAKRIAQREAMLGKAGSAVGRAETTWMSAVGLEGELPADFVADIDNYYQKLDAVRKMHQELKNSDMISEEQKKELIAQTMNINKMTDEIGELVSEYQRLSGDNVTVIGTNILDSSAGLGAYEQQLKQAVMTATNGKAQIKSFDAATKTLNYTVKTGKNEFTEYTAAVRRVGGALVAVQGDTKRTETFLEATQRKMKEISSYMSGMALLSRATQELRRGIQYVREIDLALTELKKVTSETEETYDKFLDTAAKTGARLGSTISAVTEATATFAKLGYTISDATEMAEAAIVYKNVGDNIESTEDAANSIISTMKGFKLEATESMKIVDRFNEVGKSIAHVI